MKRKTNKEVQPMYTIDFSHPSSLYFVGIGGISMSGMALLLQDAGFQVCGSDRKSVV